MEDNKKLEILRRWTCADLSFLLLKEENVKKRNSARRALFCRAGYLLFRVILLERESAGTLTLFQNSVEEQVLQDSLNYHPKRTNVSYVEKAVMSTVTLDVWVATLIRFLVAEEERGGYRQKSTPTHKEEWRRLPQSIYMAVLKTL